MTKADEARADGTEDTTRRPPHENMTFSSVQLVFLTQKPLRKVILVKPLAVFVVLNFRATTRVMPGFVILVPCTFGNE